MSAIHSPPASAGTHLEAALLVALAVALPLWEAPKNLLAAAFVLTWLTNRLRARRFGGPWDRWDTLIAVWIGSGVLVAAFAGIHFQEWRGTTDLLRYGLVLWCVKRSNLSDNAILAVIGAAFVATALGLAWGYWRWVTEAKRVYIELHSVGHVNHSAIYLAIVFGSSQSALMALWPRLGLAARAAGLSGLVCLLAFLVAMESRGALAAGLALAVVLAIAWWPRERRFGAAALLAVAVIAAALLVMRPTVVTKHLQTAATDNVLSYRDRIWITSLSALREYPVFGVGMDNFSRLDAPRVLGWSKARGEPVDEQAFFFAPHAHSLYFNTLAERGLAGFAALLAVLGAWLASLWRGYPGARGRDVQWAAWGAAFSGWFVTVVAGMANTTLHHEHALLAVLMLGLWLNVRPGRAP